ncbi:MAG: DinB family protein [Aureispira sp.]|nr:DinB family protein [Aureispira sp.]
MEQIIAQFELHTHLLRNTCKDFSDEKASQLHGEENHVKWLVGHLVSTRYYTAKLLGLDEEFKYGHLYVRGSKAEDASQFPSLEAFLVEWEKISPILINHLKSMSEEVWNSKANFQFPIHDGSLKGSFSFMAHHEAYHIGQVAYARRIVGLDGMKY